MNIILWIIQILLALLFITVGSKKAFQTDKAKESMDWAKNVPNSRIIAIGIVEILGAIGLVLPWALDIAPILTPIAAVGLALTMIVAAILHAKLKENKAVVVNIIILVLISLVAIGRFM
ncbi:DoxX family protein [Viridibacillus arvi]|uniref:DoxX family protein n=1 Tax=Viridibacillus arvi TaxID=263475 RepID=UPI003D289E20